MANTTINATHNHTKNLPNALTMLGYSPIGISWIFILIEVPNYRPLSEGIIRQGILIFSKDQCTGGISFQIQLSLFTINPMMLQIIVMRLPNVNIQEVEDAKTSSSMGIVLFVPPTTIATTEWWIRKKNQRKNLKPRSEIWKFKFHKLFHQALVKVKG